MKKMLILLSSVVLLFSLLIIPASAAGSDLILEYEDLQSAESEVLLPPGSYTISFDFSVAGATDWVSDPVVISEVLPENCMTPVFVYRDGVAVYSLTICEYDGIYVYEFTSVDEDAQEDFSNMGYVVVTFVSSNDRPDVPVKGDSTTVAVSVFDVFAGVGSWIVTSLGSVSGLFWDAAAGNLTILGVLAISALAIGLVLGLVLIISRWLRFRG